MPICVAGTLPSAKAKKIQQVLLGMRDTEQGKELLKHLSWTMGFVAASPAEYQDLAWAIHQLSLPVK